MNSNDVLLANKQASSLEKINKYQTASNDWLLIKMDLQMVFFMTHVLTQISPYCTHSNNDKRFNLLFEAEAYMRIVTNEDIHLLGIFQRKLHYCNLMRTILRRYSLNVNSITKINSKRKIELNSFKLNRNICRKIR